MFLVHYHSFLQNSVHTTALCPSVQRFWSTIYTDYKSCIPNGADQWGNLNLYIFAMRCKGHWEVIVKLTSAWASRKTPTKLFIFENSTAAHKLDNLGSATSSTLNAVRLGTGESFWPHREAKKTGSRDIFRCYLLKKQYRDPQFGCFQFKALHASGQNEVKMIRLREKAPPNAADVW